MSTIKSRFKEFFRTREASDEGIELLRMFILPFAASMKKRGLSVDDVISQFFATEVRRFFYAKALRDFSMPGGYLVTALRAVKGYGPRKVRKGQKMLIVVDKEDGCAKVEIKIDGEMRNFRLERFEIETMKDWIEVIGE